ncbi:MAG: hypothetical protein NTZ87_04135 [Candidatus Nomurabacteria bacterium]|nr:hypothetical protein [Candidatus Nomurabacteria bacterium]
MKKYLILFVVFAAVFTIGMKTVKAENSITPDVATIKQTVQAEIKATRDEAKQKIEDLKTKIKNEKDVAKAKVAELRITGRENALQRFDEAVARIDDLKDKINVQIDRFSSKGMDTTDAKDFVATAETKLTDAKTKTGEAGVLLSASVSKLTADDKTKLKTLAEDIQTLIDDSHDALNNAIKSLKDTITVKK